MSKTDKQIMTWNGATVGEARRNVELLYKRLQKARRHYAKAYGDMAKASTDYRNACTVLSRFGFPLPESIINEEKEKFLSS